MMDTLILTGVLILLALLFVILVKGMRSLHRVIYIRSLKRSLSKIGRILLDVRPILPPPGQVDGCSQFGRLTERWLGTPLDRVRYLTVRFKDGNEEGRCTASYNVFFFLTYGVRIYLEENSSPS